MGSAYDQHGAHDLRGTIGGLWPMTYTAPMTYTHAVAIFVLTSMCLFIFVLTSMQCLFIFVLTSMFRTTIESCRGG